MIKLPSGVVLDPEAGVALSVPAGAGERTCVAVEIVLFFWANEDKPSPINGLANRYRLFKQREAAV